MGKLLPILQLPHDTEKHEDLLIELWFNQVLAYDPETQAELYQSNGRTKRGGAHHYSIRVPDGRTQLEHTLHGWLRFPHKSQLCWLNAFSEKEAIEQANTIFPKKYEAFKTNPECFRLDTLEELLEQRGRAAAWLGGQVLDGCHNFFGHFSADLSQCEQISEDTWRIRVVHSHQAHLTCFIVVQDLGKQLIPRKDAV